MPMLGKLCDQAAMRIPIVLALLSMPAVALAQSYTGDVKVIDGDTLDMAGTRIRLHGIDAVERSQSCSTGAGTWACGKEATSTLAAIIRNRAVECVQKDEDKFGRIVAECRVGSINLPEAMADAGFAVALDAFSDDYGDDEARAKAASRGTWASQFEIPSAYRAAHPQFDPPPTTSHLPVMRARLNAVYFRNCAELRIVTGDDAVSDALGIARDIIELQLDAVITANDADIGLREGRRGNQSAGGRKYGNCLFHLFPP